MTLFKNWRCYFTAHKWQFSGIKEVEIGWKKDEPTIFRNIIFFFCPKCSKIDAKVIQEETAQPCWDCGLL